MKKKVNILWVDDEIDLLRPHIIFLEKKGYDVAIASNGGDAAEMVKTNDYDLIFLDENMPGLSGLETLKKISESRPSVPVVMITKSEEEDIMDAAVGSKIADYLIKPVNPNQILLSIKKNIDHQTLVTHKTTSDYRAEFNQISLQISSAHTFSDWSEIYKRLLFYELELDSSSDASMSEVFKLQKHEADIEFSKFIRSSYLKWLDASVSEKPVLSHNLLRNYIFPVLKKGEKLVLLLIDNMRFDQWRILQPHINQYYLTEQENIYCSILPTSTQYARNAIFAGMMPADIQKQYPRLWLNDEDEGNKNEHEEELLQNLLQRSGMKVKVFYQKIFNNNMGGKVLENLNNILLNDLVVLVYNFVDMLSHANTDMEMIRELASTDSAYRSLTLSWFRHSHLLELFNELAQRNINVFMTTDHGTIRVNHPVKVLGDKTTSRNLRYKLGKNLSYNPKEVFEVTIPEKAFLPRSTMSSRYIFALRDDFFAYPNNYNYYVKYYTNTYQHGGISMEEMILPFVKLKSKLV